MPKSKSSTPDAIELLKQDHANVKKAFKEFEKMDHEDTATLQELVVTVCSELKVHTAIEEEIFYPAVRAVTQNDVIAKSLDEHREMRRLIGQLRQMEPDTVGYDETVTDLMRDVMHHVADEETLVLPEAERLLADQLGELGMQMTKRRLQLVGPRSGEIALDMGRAVSGHTVALAMVGVTAMGLLVARRSGHLDLSRFRGGRSA